MSGSFKLMITKVQMRNNSGDMFDCGTLKFRTSGEALGNMLEVELGWGAKVTEVTPTRISLLTHVLNCIDYSTFEGPAEEMEPLYLLVVTLCHSDQQFKGVIVDQAWATMQRVCGQDAGKPLFVKMMAGLALGGARIRAAVMLSAGFTNEADVQLGLESRVSLKDLAAVADLARQSGLTFRDALALV
jgi:hypothetical protein